MGLATLSSRILGMLREMVYAGFMGDSVVASAFKTALMIPNLFRRLLGEGALTAAFIPIFKEKERNEGEAEMWKAANAVISRRTAERSLVQRDARTSRQSTTGMPSPRHIRLNSALSMPRADAVTPDPV